MNILKNFYIVVMMAFSANISMAQESVDRQYFVPPEFYWVNNDSTFDFNGSEFVIDRDYNLISRVSAGGYKYLDNDVVKMLGDKGSGTETFTAKLFYVKEGLGNCAAQNEALTRMKNEGFEPGRIEHLLAIGEASKNIDFSTEFVFATGTTKNGKVPVIYTSPDGNMLAAFMFRKSKRACYAGVTHLLLGIRKQGNLQK